MKSVLIDIYLWNIWKLIMKIGRIGVDVKKLKFFYHEITLQKNNILCICGVLD